MASRRWAGDLRNSLLTLRWPEFHALYPDIPKGTFKSQKNYWQKKEGMMERPPDEAPYSSEIPEGSEVSWHVGYIKNSEGEIEYTKPLLSVKPNQSQADVDDLFPQIEASTIRPSKRKRIERVGRTALAYGDGQVSFRRIINPLTEAMELMPTHNVEVHRIILQMNAHYRPETTLNGGDFADNPESSRFDPDSDHYHKTMTPAYRWIHDFYAQMVADNPDAEHVEVDSNHAERIKKTVLKNTPQYYDFYRPGEDYPAWTYYSMANLGKLGIKFVSGYKAAMYMYAEDTGNPIGVHHGHTSSSVPGSTVRKEMQENPDISIVRFHGHNYEVIARTARDGRQLLYVQLPSSCINDGPTAGYRNAVDDKNRPVDFYNPHHQTGFGIIRTSPGGDHQIDYVPVVDGKAFYDGMEWDGTQPYEWEKKYGYVKDGEE